MTKLWLFPLGLALALAGGCVAFPAYRQPVPPMPETWPAGAAYAPAPTADPRPASNLPWRDFVADPRLRRVVETALAQNRDLRLAALNVERAQALYRIQRAERAPALGAAASASVQRVPADLSGTGNHERVERYAVDLGVFAWEADLFGRMRSLEQSVLHEYFATEQGRHAAQLLLVANVVQAYLALAADRENLTLAQTTLTGQLAAQELVQRRFDSGATPELDLHRARAQVETARGAVARFTQRVAQDENALALLAGGPLAAEWLPAHLADIAPLTEVAAGLSSAVLLQRPDIRQAEQRLRAAHANLDAARAAFFPRLSLTATAGLASPDLGRLFTSSAGTWALVPRLEVPIFDPRVRAAARVALVDQELAVTQYERAIQVSFREVADALAARGTVDAQVAAQEALVQAVAETHRLSQVRYERGVDSYLSVLDAQRSLYAAQQELVALRQQKLASQVRLYAALGGGWQPEPPTP